MRTTLLLLVALCGVACSRGATDDPAAAHVARGESDLSAGRVDAARTHFESARREARDPAWRTRAERRLLAIRKVEIATEDALARLQALCDELAKHPSPAAEAEFAKQRDAVLAVNPAAIAEADRLRAEGATALSNARAAERAAVEELIAAKHLAAAVLVVRDLEQRRAAGDVADLRELLERIAAESESLAEHCLKVLPTDSTEALAALDESLVSLAGTPGAARLWVERVVRAGSIKRPEATAPRDSAVPGESH